MRLVRFSNSQVKKNQHVQILTLFSIGGAGGGGGQKDPPASFFLVTSANIRIRLPKFSDF